MTEEQKQHAETAGAFADTLGALEGATKKVSKWDERADEQHELHKKDVASAIALRDAELEGIRINTVRAERYEARQFKEWEQSAERHSVWLADVKHVQAHREREVAAFERIAEALEKLAPK